MDVGEPPHKYGAFGRFIAVFVGWLCILGFANVKIYLTQFHHAFRILQLPLSA